jgi:hypothetical protein
MVQWVSPYAHYLVCNPPAAHAMQACSSWA